MSTSTPGAQAGAPPTDGSQVGSRRSDGAGAERVGPRAHLFRVAPLVVAGLGVFAAVAARDLEVGGLIDPGPGMWPMIVSVVTMMTGLLLVWRDLPVDYETWDRRAFLVVIGVVVLAVFIQLFQILGFLVAAFLALVVWLKGLAGERWWVALTLALVGAVALDLIFENFFGVPFPTGIVRLGGA